MLKLIQVEFLKLRRRKLIWIMLLAAFVLPFFALLYFNYFGKTGVDPMLFYKWSAFGYTSFIILPFILGILCTILMHDENRYDMMKQLWIVPVSKMGYFFSKFVIVLVYAICFMLITAVASVLFSVLSGYVIFDWESVSFLLERCLETALLAALAILPILAAAASQKGYILPVCTLLVYIFFGFFIMSVNMYLHPLSGIAVIIARDGEIPGLALMQAAHVPLALLCFCVWDVAAVILAKITLRRK